MLFPLKAVVWESTVEVFCSEPPSPLAILEELDLRMMGRALGLGGHCSVLFRTFQALAIPGGTDLRILVFDFACMLLPRNPELASSPSKISSYFVPT